MTIGSTIENMMIHPYFKDAIKQYNEGNTNDLKFLLIDLSTHVYQQTSSLNAVTYRQNKRYSPTEIYQAIKDMPPPENLNFWLKAAVKVQPVQAECKVINFIKEVKKKAIRYFAPNQLTLFPDYCLQAEA